MASGFTEQSRFASIVRRKLIVVGAVLLLTVAAGCLGGGGGGGDSGSGTPDWCGQESVGQFTGVQDSEVTVSVEGMTERDGQQVCEVSYEFTDAESQQFAGMDVFYTEDRSYMVAVYHDGDGNVIQEIDLTERGDTGS